MARGREIKIYITGDAKDAQRAFRQIDQSSSKLGNLGGGLARIGSIGKLALGGVAAGLGVLAFKGVQTASDLNESMSATIATFGDFSDGVIEAADEMNEKFGISKRVFLDSATSLGAIGKSAGMTRAEASKMGVDFSKLAADLSSFANIPMEEALGAIRSGLVGEAEPLRRHGVQLNENAVQAEAMRLGLLKASDATKQLSAEEQKAADEAQRVSDAERNLRDAMEASERAQESLTEAREDATRKLEDLKLAVQGDALAEERAEIRLAEAKKRVREADAEDRREAELDLKQAQLDLTEARRDRAQGAEELAQAEKKGVEGSEQVQDALRSERDASEGVAAAKKEIASVTQKSNTALTEAMKIQARMSLITEGLADKQGDLARTADSPANAFRKFEGAVEGLMGSIGIGLMPAIQALMPTVNALVPVLGEALGGVAAALAPLLMEVAKALGPILMPIVKGLAPLAKILVNHWAQLFKELVPLIPVIVDLALAFVPLLPPLSRLIVLLVKMLVPILKPVIVLVSALAGMLATLAGIVIDVVNAALEPLASVFRSIGRWLTPVVDAIKRFGDKLGGLLNKLPKWMRPGSPTPLETGLVGIANGFDIASRAADRFEVPDTSKLADLDKISAARAVASAKLPDTRQLARADLGRGSGGTVININVTANGVVGDSSAVAERIRKDLLRLKGQIGRDLGLS